MILLSALKKFLSPGQVRQSTPFIIVACLIFGAFTSVSAQKKKRPMEVDSLQERQTIESKFYFFNGIKEKNSGNFDLALDNFKKALDLNPGNDATYYEMARIYSQKADYPHALESVKKALDLSKDNNYYQVFAADLYLQLGESKEALKLYESAVEKHPDNIDAYLAIAAIYESQKNFKDANKYYSLAEERTGPQIEISQQKITNYVTAGKFDLAIEEIRKLIKEFPQEVQFQEMLSDMYSYNNQPDKAEAVIKSILATDPHSGAANLKMARIDLQKKDLNASLASAAIAFGDPSLPIDSKMELMFVYLDMSEKDKTFLDKLYNLGEILTKTDSDDAKSFSIYGDLLNREQKFAEARDQFRKAVALSPDKHLIWQEILSLDSRLNDSEGLDKDSEKCISLFPSIPAFYFYNGIASYQLKNFSKAIQSLESGLALVVDDDELKAQFNATLGDACNSVKNYKKSDEYYESALKLSPNDVYVLNNYSYYLSLRGEQLEKAAGMAQKAVQLAPNQPNYQDTYAWVLYKMQKFDEARQQLEKALDNGGSSGEIFEHYGDVMYKLGNTAKAVEFWKKAKAAGDTTEHIDKKIAEQKLIE